MKKSSKLIITSIILFAFIILLFIFWKQLSLFFQNPEEIRKFILQYGALAPIIFIILVGFQTIIAPIPGQLTGIAGGFIFGPWLGTLYSLLGICLGSYIVFILARKFGVPLLKVFVNDKTYNKYNKVVQEKGIFFLFLVYLIPGLPDDAISYIAGLTNIKIKNLLIISFIGRFPGTFLLSLFGAEVNTRNYLSIILFVSLAIISLILYIFKDKIERIFLKRAKK